LQCRPEVALQTHDETSDVQSSQVGDGGKKNIYRKFPSFDENQLPTEAAEENVVEIEALGTANPKTKLINDVEGTEQKRQNPKSRSKLGVLNY
jgi:hypothetical protein